MQKHIGITRWVASQLQRRAGDLHQAASTQRSVVITFKRKDAMPRGGEIFS